MIISLIAALTINHVIGANSNLPWHLPVDMRWFRYHTLNKPIIMGRKTFESIGKKPLRNRLNIVLSRFLSSALICDEIYIVNNIHQALSLAKNFSEEVMVVGGGEVYKNFLPISERLYLTYINTDFCIYGDTWFPFYDIADWKSVFSQFCVVNNQSNCYYLNFSILERLV